MVVPTDLWLDVMNKYAELTLNNFKNKMWIYFSYWQNYVIIDIKRRKERIHKIVSDKEIFIVDKIFYKIKEVQRANKNKRKYI